jgi:hypothetical protein
MRVSVPDVGPAGYFVQTRQCVDCAGKNVIELRGAESTVSQLRNGRRRTAHTTQKIECITEKIDPTR